MKAELKEIAWTRPAHEIFAGLCDRRGAFLLDSALEAGGLGRYSFIGSDPFLTFRAADGLISLRRVDGGEDYRGEALDELKKLMARHRCEVSPAIPFPGGAVGFFSYEFGSSLEKVGGSSFGQLDTPDVHFDFYDGLVMFDNKERRAFLVACPVAKYAPVTVFRRLEMALAEAERRPSPAAARTGAGEIGASMTKPDYLRAVGRIKEYIAAGDVYQVNLTQRFDAALPCHPYALFQKLRARSPAPFACYLNGNEWQIVGSSPERFLRIAGDRIETRPIKGTRPRGKTLEDDARLRGELLASVKDRAELLMIVDLERNDLGRVCVPGSIAVDELCTVESHPTVHHLVANVSGRLQPGLDAIDGIRAALPGGSITGAPKVRSMQIINELENTRRGIYTGAAGYLGFDGGCDLNIAIRTIICSHGRAYYHVGGGVVWDSDPEAEYQETLDKGAAMRAALVEP